MQEMLSPAQVAQRCITSRRSVMRAIERYELKAIRDNRNHWKISAEDADEWAASRWAPSEQDPLNTLTVAHSSLTSKSPVARTENNQSRKHLVDRDTLITELREELVGLRERAKSDSRLLEERANHIADLQRRLDRAENRLALGASPTVPVRRRSWWPWSR